MNEKEFLVAMLKDLETHIEVIKKRLRKLNVQNNNVNSESSRKELVE